MKISLGEDLEAFATGERVRARGFASASEYVRHLIRTDRELDRMRKVVRDGLDSGPSAPFPRDYFGKLRGRFPKA